MSAGALNLLVFREGRRGVSGEALRSRLLEQIAALTESSCQDDVLGALLCAGELECAAADAGCSSAILQEITDDLAEALAGLKKSSQPDLLKLVSICSLPEQASISVAEGFAYYALHPLAYANVVRKLPGLGQVVAVIGIRSIGTTLSAMAAAGAQKEGKQTSRITVRPQGHPYNRELRFSGDQQEFITRALAENADFLVVDEGPGLSGSSFLAVAEALAELNVPRQKITVICGHEPDFGQFRANNGEQRAQNFRWVAVDATPRCPEEATDFIGGGNWRERLYSNQSAWPESWTSFERLKFLSSPREGEIRLYKFAGLGDYGAEVFRREQRVAEAEFAAEPRNESDGFISYPWLSARPMSAADLNEDVIRRLAEYCAFRANAFAADSADLHGLQQMAAHNLQQLGIDVQVSLQLDRPVIVDGRMQPHEWLLTVNCNMLKTDSGSHGDDHFFPGPTDIAWDLAGAIVEWRMNRQQTHVFLESYCLLSGDNPAGRINDFVVAYTTFRAAYCLMAANALHGSEEQRRMEKAAAIYRLALEQHAGAAPASFGASS